MSYFKTIPLWTILAPIFAWLLLIFQPQATSNIFVGLSIAVIFAAVIAAVHHAEVVAHRVGEPFGTLVLAVSVTIIEVALIVSLMMSGGADVASLARDTVFATVMIILNGIVGLCLLMGGSRFGEQRFGLLGVSASLATLTAIVVLTLILPNYTTTVAGPVYSTSQLGFVAIVSLVLYGTFVFVQAVRHRDYFLPNHAAADEDVHAQPPSNQVAIISSILLFMSLGAVVLLAKTISPSVELMLNNAGAPKTVIGIVIAAIVLLPEALAALRAARANRLQTSLNLALGSALASIGLTIPAVALVSIYSGMPLMLGIDVKSTVLLMLSLFVASLSLGTGKTTVLQGTIHILIFMVYLFTTIVP